MENTISLILPGEVLQRYFRALSDFSVRVKKYQQRSKGFVIVGDNLYKRSTSGILMKCVTLEEGKDILREIHKGVCGNHAASRTLVGKAYRSGFFWPTAVSDAEDLVKRCLGF